MLITATATCCLQHLHHRICDDRGSAETVLYKYNMFNELAAMMFAIIKRWFASQTTNWFLQQLKDIPTSGTTRSKLKRKKTIFHNECATGKRENVTKKKSDPARCVRPATFFFQLHVLYWRLTLRSKCKLHGIFIPSILHCTLIQRLRSLDSSWRFAIATREHSITGKMSFILYYSKWDSHSMSHTVCTVVSFAGNSMHCATRTNTHTFTECYNVDACHWYYCHVDGMDALVQQLEWFTSAFT